MPRVREVDGHTCVMDYSSPRITAEYYECGLPLTFDQYNRCAFNCPYCFSAFFAVGHSVSSAAVKGVTSSEGIKNLSKYRNAVRSVDPERVKRYWLEAETRRWAYTDLMIVNLIRRRTPVHWGGLCDPFDPFERRFKVGLELLHFFRALDWPVLSSTKGTLMTESPWSDAMAGGNFRFQFSITTLDPAKAKVNDSGVVTPQARLDAMRFVTGEMGCGAVLRLRPIVPGMISPEECCELIRLAHAAGASGGSTEFFCLEQRGLENRAKYERMSAAVGFDIYEYYRRESPGQSGYLRLNRRVKAEYFVPMAAEAARLGMRFSVSDMHFKELGTVSGCCGAYWDDEGGQTRDGHAGVFVNRGTITYAHILGKRNGVVHWAEVAETLGWADVPLTGNGNIQGLMSDGIKRAQHRYQTLTEALRSQWNDPNSGKSPYRYGGGRLYPDGLDEGGDVVYRYRSDDEMAAGFPMTADEPEDEPSCGSACAAGAAPGPEVVPASALVRSRR